MRTVIAAFGVLLVALAGCDGGGASVPAVAEREAVVRTTVAPIDWMTRRIAGDLVPVELLCPAGQDPVRWRPGPDVVARYQRAALIVSNGAEFETWVRLAPLPRSRIVRSADAIGENFLTVPGEAHSHGPEGTHAHDVINGRTWTDPLNAIAQAGAIGDAMATSFPEHADAFAENQARLISELRAFHERLEALGSAGVAVVAPESELDYLARRYAWLTGEIDSSPRAWVDARANDGASDASGQTILLCLELPDESTAARWQTVHGVRAILWRTGERAGGPPYGEVLAGNVERLERAIAESTP